MTKKIIGFIALMVFGVSLGYTQQTDEREGANQAEINAGGEPREDDAQVNPSQIGDRPAGSEDVGEQDANLQRDATQQSINTIGVNQTTTSSSGSPAILSGADGKDRDGTNTVQRATPNIAGAAIPAEESTRSVSGKQKGRATENDKADADDDGKKEKRKDRKKKKDND